VFVHGSGGGRYIWCGEKALQNNFLCQIWWDLQGKIGEKVIDRCAGMAMRLSWGRIFC